MQKNTRSPMDLRVSSWITQGVSRVFIYANNRHGWAIGARAKIDTGADRCSIDIDLAEALRLEVIGEVNVRNANGVVKRPLYCATIKFEREKYDVTMTGSDRSGLECPMLIGRDLLKDICLYEEEE